MVKVTITHLDWAVNVAGSVNHALIMNSAKLKRKLGDLGVDTSSKRASENFCLVMSSFLLPSYAHGPPDRHASTAPRKVQRYRRIRTTLEARSQLLLVSGLFI